MADVGDSASRRAMGFLGRDLPRRGRRRLRVGNVLAVRFRQAVAVGLRALSGRPALAGGPGADPAGRRDCVAGDSESARQKNRGGADDIRLSVGRVFSAVRGAGAGDSGNLLVGRGDADPGGGGDWGCCVAAAGAVPGPGPAGAGDAGLAGDVVVLHRVCSRRAADNNAVYGVGDAAAVFAGGGEL